MILRTVVAIVCLLSTGCVGGRPIHYYTIDRLPGAPAAAKPDGAVLLVGRITTPEALQDGRIRYRAGDNEVGAYEYHRWAERPGLMVQDLLLETLRASGKYRQVQEASSASPGDYLVRGRLYEFAEIDDPGIQSRVSLRLELLDRKAGLVVWDHHYNSDQPVDGKTMKAVVLSLEHNLQQVIADAASGIETFLLNRNQGAIQ
jgi:cholesterol transport system auxiliary component